MNLLVLNNGSSSLKYTLFDMATERPILSGTIDRIGLENSCHLFEAYNSEGERIDLIINDHGAALDEMFRIILERGSIASLDELKVICHRVAHGGRFRDPVQITPEVISEIRRMTPFFPLHHPAIAMGIEESIFRAPHAIHVAVFDMTFHKTIPDVAAIYGLPYRYFAEKGYRKIGYHGHSNEYVSDQAARFLKKDLSDLKLISCHLGNGCSVTAIDGGKSVDTTMGMTSVEGLMMGTRSGDVDPGLIPVIMKEDSISPDGLIDLLYRKSGLLGVSGLSRDMREISLAAAGDNPRAKLALDAFCYKIKRAIGSMLMALGGCDALIFTGGIGLHSDVVRKKTLKGAEDLGFCLDHRLNSSCGKHDHTDVTDISSENSRVRILVIKTFEEIIMARQSLKLVEELNGQRQAN
jgi:acetate kinase